MKAMAVREIPDAERITPKRFRQECTEKGTPALFRGLVAGWPLVGTSAGGFLAAWPQRSIRTFAISVDGLGAAKTDLTVAQIAGYLAADDGAARKRGDGLVLDVTEDVPELLPLAPAPPLHDRPIRHRIFMGHDTITDTHYHSNRHNLICQVLGRKRVVLHSPHDSARLYPPPVLDGPKFNTSRVDLLCPDVEKFPKFLGARPLEATLEPGDALYVPAHWWHTVYGIGCVASVSLFWEARLRDHFFPRPDLRDFMGLLRWHVWPHLWGRPLAE